MKTNTFLIKSMEHSEAIKFYVDLIVEKRKSFCIVTNESEMESIQSSAEEFFDFLDDQQLEYLEGETNCFRPGLMEAYANYIMHNQETHGLTVKPKQFELAYSLKHTGELPDSFWKDVSKETAMILGFFPRMSKHGFLTAQIVRHTGVYDVVNNYFHDCLTCYNQKRAIEYFNLNGIIEPK